MDITICARMAIEYCEFIDTSNAFVCQQTAVLSDTTVGGDCVSGRADDITQNEGKNFGLFHRGLPPLHAC